jgi:hypothetical protein
MSDYEPPKWLKKQFVELVHKIPTEDIHEIIIEAANDAANLAFDHVYETLVTLASEKPSLPVKEAMAAIIAGNAEPLKANVYDYEKAIQKQTRWLTR